MVGSWARGVVLVAVLGMALWPVTARSIHVGPADDFCLSVNSLRSGEELLLRPGDYSGPCTVRRGGTPGAPVVIRAADPARRPRLSYDGTTSNVIEIRADHVTLRGLAFGPTRRDVDAIRIVVGNDITVEDCVFSGLQGIAIVANHVSVHGLVVRGNVIEDSEATAMYFGCHDGISCTVTALFVERNLIHRIRAPAPEVGYGIQVKTNSESVIQDNIVVDTKGPGIMVYGSTEPSRLARIERNFTGHSRTSSGIVVAGGPALVRNNVAVANAIAGIVLHDYAGRGLLRDIAIVHNTVYANLAGGITAPPGRGRGVAILNNAVHTRVDTPPVPDVQPGVLVAGNVNCSAGACFTDPAAWNFSPFPGSLLLGRGQLGHPGLPSDDFLHEIRDAPPTAGAFERSAGPVKLQVKPAHQ